MCPKMNKNTLSTCALCGFRVMLDCCEVKNMRITSLSIVDSVRAYVCSSLLVFPFPIASLLSVSPVEMFVDRSHGAGVAGGIWGDVRPAGLGGVCPGMALGYI